MNVSIVNEATLPRLDYETESIADSDEDYETESDVGSENSDGSEIINLLEKEIEREQVEEEIKLEKEEQMIKEEKALEKEFLETNPESDSDSDYSEEESE